MKSSSTWVVVLFGEEDAVGAGVVTGDPRDLSNIETVSVLGAEDDLARGGEGEEDREGHEEGRGLHVCRNAVVFS